MNVGELRKAIADMSDDADVIIDLETDDEGGLVQCDVESASAETRCDGVAALYLRVPADCPDCGGAGYNMTGVSTDNESARGTRECETCGGTGVRRC